MVHLCSFSGSLSELPKGQRTIPNALRVLLKDKRVSTFERGAPWLERLIDQMKADKLIEEDHLEPYPWHRFMVTDAGVRAAAAMSEAAPPTARCPRTSEYERYRCRHEAGHQGPCEYTKVEGR